MLPSLHFFFFDLVMSVILYRYAIADKVIKSRGGGELLQITHEIGFDSNLSFMISYKIT